MSAKATCFFSPIAQSGPYGIKSNMPNSSGTNAAAAVPARVVMLFPSAGAAPGPVRSPTAASRCSNAAGQDGVTRHV